MDGLSNDIISTVQSDELTQLPHCDDGVQVRPDPFRVGREEVGFGRQ